MMESLADAVLFEDYSTNYDALRLTHNWIGDSAGITSKDTAVWLEALRGGDGSTRGWVAWATTIAAAEIRAERNQVWGTSEQDYLKLLRQKAGYAPTAWEVAREAEYGTTDAFHVSADSQEQAS
jgi:hypothetical protein